MTHLPTVENLPSPPSGKTGFPWTAAPKLTTTIPISINIVTPSFNQVAYLEQTIRSVLLQGYSNLQYIIIDGGSTDGSVDIIRKYEPWLAYWVSEPDKGQADAINKGWRKSLGEIVAWLNSDDYYLPGTLNAIASRMAADPELGLVYGDIQVLDGGGKLSAPIGYESPETEMLAKFEIPYQPACFFRRTLVEHLGGLDPSLHYVMDVDILLKIMATASYAYLPLALAVFRLHAQSKTQLSEVGFAKELLQLLDRVTRNTANYPDLVRLSTAKIRRNFYRLAAKHFYQGDHFSESLRYITLACLADPSATLAILRDEGLGWLTKRVLPIEKYRSLAYRLRSKSTIVAHENSPR